METTIEADAEGCRRTMKVLTIGLSPAIDATVRIGAWPTAGSVARVADETLRPGGKGLNVARWLALRGATVACAGLLGRDNADVFERELAALGIEDRFVRVAGATRVNEMFVAPEGEFKVNRAAFPGLSPETCGFSAAAMAADGFDTIVISGSLPAGFPAETVRDLVAEARRTGARVVLDTSGAALAAGAQALPDVLKPNAEECAALVGFVPATPDDFRRATDCLRRFCGFPIVSDGAAGCWFDGEFVAAPSVEVRDTTAAGDTLLAEWCFSGDIRMAVAAGSAACTMPGGEPPPRELVEKLVALLHSAEK